MARLTWATPLLIQPLRHSRTPQGQGFQAATSTPASFQGAVSSVSLSRAALNKTRPRERAHLRRMQVAAAATDAARPERCERFCPLAAAKKLGSIIACACFRRCKPRGLESHLKGQAHKVTKSDIMACWVHAEACRERRDSKRQRLAALQNF